MDSSEAQFFQRLITAAWPLYLQLGFALGIACGYYLWSRSFYQFVDPALRRLVGNALGVRLRWVLRHSSSYQTSAELGFSRRRYQRWTWGIEKESQRTFFLDNVVALLSLLLVNALSGLWPIAVFFYVFLALKALSYVVFLPACIALLVIYAAFWSGRYEVKGMR